MDLCLRRHPAEQHLRPLDRPFLCLAGDATVGTLLAFLAAKLETAQNGLQLLRSTGARTTLLPDTPLDRVAAVTPTLYYRRRGRLDG